jgi:hypothetical protein
MKVGHSGYRDPGAAPLRRAAAAFAAAVTVAIAVGADVLAEGHPLHLATLGLVAAMVAVLRARPAGRHGGLFAAVSGIIVVADRAAIQTMCPRRTPSS